MGSDPSELVSHYVTRLVGPDAEDAFHRLVGGPRTIVPLLIEAYAQEKRPALKAAIVKVVWQFRDPDTVSFLTAALAEQDDPVWKQALDGLVAIGGDSAEAALCKSLEHETEPDKHDWIREAVEQIRSDTATGGVRPSRRDWSSRPAGRVHVVEPAGRSSRAVDASSLLLWVAVLFVFGFALVVASGVFGDYVLAARIVGIVLWGLVILLLWLIRVETGLPYWMRSLGYRVEDGTVSPFGKLWFTVLGTALIVSILFSS